MADMALTSRTFIATLLDGDYSRVARCTNVLTNAFFSARVGPLWALRNDGYGWEGR
jgi:hypothetical protein